MPGKSASGISALRSCATARDVASTPCWAPPSRSSRLPLESVNSSCPLPLQPLGAAPPNVPAQGLKLLPAAARASRVASLQAPAESAQLCTMQCLQGAVPCPMQSACRHALYRCPQSGTLTCSRFKGVLDVEVPPERMPGPSPSQLCAGGDTLLRSSTHDSDCTAASPSDPSQRCTAASPCCGLVDGPGVTPSCGEDADADFCAACCGAPVDASAPAASITAACATFATRSGARSFAR